MSTMPLNEYLDQFADEQTEKFRIKTNEQAIWAMRKLYGINQEISGIQETAQQEIDRINTWAADEIKKLEGNASYFKNILEEYHRRLFAEDNKKKTIKLPHGDLQLRAQQPDFTKDDEKIISWAEQNRPEFVIIPPPPEKKLDWAEMKNAIKVVKGKVIDPSIGEIIPGIEVMERNPKFSIKLKS